MVDAEISFQRGEKGEIVAVQHSQGGNTFKAAKLAESKVKLSPEIITSILGEYEYGPGAIMKVTNEGEQLFAQLTNQPKMPIFPISDEEFEWHVVEAKVKFVPDAEGKIVKAVHRQNGGTIDAPKIK